MCKCCLICLETCYWNLIEEKFCFDENIALYQEPSKKPMNSNNEKNNNLFDNIAFFDSVSVIAGRAIVTIDPLPSSVEKGQKNQSIPAAAAVIVDQPKKLKRLQRNPKDLETHYLKNESASIKNTPKVKHEKNILENVDEIDATGKTSRMIQEEEEEEDDIRITDEQQNDDIQEKLLRRKHFQHLFKKPSLTSAITITHRNKFPIKKSVSFHNIPEKTLNFNKTNDGYNVNTTNNESTRSSKTNSENRVQQNDEYDDDDDGAGDVDVDGNSNQVTFRKRTLRERRMSKSLSLKIELPELPIIRQNSMPKFYLDTPDENQIKESTLIKRSAAASVLKSPLLITSSADFTFDLHSIVQIQKEQQQQQQQQYNYSSSTSSSTTSSSTAILKSTPPAVVPIHRESSRLNMIKEKMKLKKSKSTVNTSSLPSYSSNYI